ncbi:hypothetical protein ACQKCH_09740 [Nubsella zeaxanthinifaciens]|uniref:hypothetical protein n=1 Tax=Nubsella zeaxanthinifaciens TaxID=392412 RepID=UPI003D0840CE
MKCTVLLWIGFLMFAIGCTNPDKNDQTTEAVDTAVAINAIDTAAEKDVLATVGTEILTALNAKDYKSFAAYFHPKKGVLFSPYGMIDRKNATQLTKANFLKIIEEHGSINWGSYDGSGEPIKLTAQKYLDKFVYNANYLHAEKTSFNEIIGKGNSASNLNEIFPDHPFLEYYFSGFDKKYDGMDWSSLRLVFEQYQSTYFLVAVVHDQWTI